MSQVHSTEELHYLLEFHRGFHCEGSLNHEGLEICDHILILQASLLLFIIKARDCGMEVLIEISPCQLIRVRVLSLISWRDIWGSLLSWCLIVILNRY